MKLVKFWNYQWSNRQPLLLKHNCWIQKNVQNSHLSGQNSFQSTMFLFCKCRHIGISLYLCWKIFGSSAKNSVTCHHFRQETQGVSRAQLSSLEMLCSF